MDIIRPLTREREFTMSKGKKQQYKQFAINTLEDGCMVLQTLIIPVIMDLERFKEYSKEAEELLAKCTLTKDIPASIYDPIHDRILYRQRELLRYIADHQSSSFSYISVRELLMKKKFLDRELDTASKETLKELLDIRNWTFHNSQSMLVAEREVAKKSIPPELTGMVDFKPMLNPVVINKVTSYSKEFLQTFIWHNQIRAEQFEQILTEMKKDYQDMYDALPVKGLPLMNCGLSTRVQYVEQEVKTLDPDGAGAKVSEVSMRIQKGKYDGK